MKETNKKKEDNKNDIILPYYNLEHQYNIKKNITPAPLNYP